MRNYFYKLVIVIIACGAVLCSAYFLLGHEYESEKNTKDEKIIGITKDGNCEDRLQVILELRNNKSEEILPVLLKLMDDDCMLIRSVAAELIGDIGGPKAVVALNDALKDKENELLIYESVLKALAKIGNEESVKNIIKILSEPKKKSTTIIEEALQTLSEIGGKESDSYLISFVLDKDNNSFDRIVAVELVGKTNFEVLYSLINNLNGNSNAVRAAIIKLLGEYGDERAVLDLKRLKSDDCKEISELAEEAIVKILSREEK